MSELRDRWRSIVQTVCIEQKVTLDTLLLFGSRARGDDDDGSDIDLLVILVEDITRQESLDISRRIREDFAVIREAVDVVIVSRATFDVRKDVIGSISRTASQEGVVL